MTDLVKNNSKALLQFIRDKTLDDYNADLLLQSGVERKLMIIAEALNQANKSVKNNTSTEHYRLHSVRLNNQRLHSVQNDAYG